MASTLGIVEVPKSPAPGRYLRASFADRRIGGKPLLEWVIRRVTESLLLDQVVVLFDGDQADALGPLTPPDIETFESNQPDALSRFADVCRSFQASNVVRVSCNCPFVDPALIDRLICTANAHPGYDYIGYCVQDGQPTVQSKLGLFAEWCRADAILRADERAKALGDREEVTRFLFSHSELFQLRLVPAPTPLDRRDLRLTISDEEDWENAHMILDALGPDQLDWQAIVGLLKQQPALRKRMADQNLAEQTV